MAKVVQQARDCAKLGLKPANPGVDMAKVSEYVQGVIRRVEEAERAYTEGVTVKFGKVAFRSSSELALNGESISSRNTIIATGSHPVVPNIEGLAETGYLTNEGVFDLTRLPATIVIVESQSRWREEDCHGQTR